jgi:inward rectifier potassium channel
MEISPQELKDLGFGRAAEGSHRLRMMNRDGSFNVKKVGVSSLESLGLYHWFLTMTWPRFFGAVSLFYLLINAFFAGIFVLCGPDALHGINGVTMTEHYIQSFFFSVQTLATVGYGAIYPNNFPANLVVTLETVVGLLATALVTGLVFARFARPVAKLRFSTHALIAPFQGLPSFQFRIVNLRKSQLLEPRVTVIFSRFCKANGNETRKFDRLNLYLHQIVFFPLYWTVTHKIDQDSPLYNLTSKDLTDMHAEFLILLNGVDEGFSDLVYARTSYQYDEIVFNAKFSDIYQVTDDGQPAVDVTRMSQFEIMQ